MNTRPSINQTIISVPNTAATPPVIEAEGRAGPMHAAGLRLPEDVRALFSAMVAMYKYEVTDLEAMLWEDQIFSVYPPDMISRAMKAHMSTGTRDSKFMPTWGDIKALLAPVPGFLQIEQAIRSGNPYVPPPIEDLVLIEAIQQMGGWSQVCSELPDSRERPIDYDRYVKRFEAALVLARKRVNVEGVAVQRLGALGAPSQPALARTAVAALPAPAGPDGSALPVLPVRTDEPLQSLRDAAPVLLSYPLRPRQS